MKALFTLALCSTFFFAQAQDRTLNSVETELQRLVQDPALKHGQVSFTAVNLDNGRVIAEYNPYRALVPASIQKLFTTASALDHLGPNYQFKTAITYSGVIENGTLKGNLIIDGAGDPTLQSRYFTSTDQLKRITDALAEAGITRVEGKVIMDVSAFAKHTTPDAWSWEDMGNYFGASPTAFMWEDNMLKVELRSGQAGTNVMLANAWPSDSPFTLDLDIQASEVDKDDAWFFSAPGSKQIYGKGTIPAHKDRFTVKISNPDPVLTFAQLLIKDAHLGSPEIQVNYTHIPYTEAIALTTLTSFPLSEIIRITNQQSVNLCAEALNLACDASERGKSVEGGLAGTEAFLKTQKVNLSGVRLLDGNGVSPANRMTAQAMTELLSAMYRHPHREVFKSSLAVGGESGTLKYYFQTDLTKGNVIGKSGTLTNVRNYAGYVKNKYGENIAFCLMMNDYDEDRRAEVMKKVEALMEAVIQD